MAKKLAPRLKTAAIISAVAAPILIPSCYGARSYFGIETIQTRVNDASMTKVSDQYMVATDHGPFKNVDAWYRGKFNSGDVQNEAIKSKGREVELDVYGWRLRAFSMYRNVRSIRTLDSSSN
jgi:hypothetical protein